MEREAVIQEQSSLESQLASLRTHISNLDLEVAEQKAKVYKDFLSCLILWYKNHFLMICGAG